MCTTGNPYQRVGSADDWNRAGYVYGASELDFLVGSTYLEVKTPLTTVDVKYGDKVRTKKVTPFSSTDRMVKHVRELAGSLKDHERAILLTMHQYEPTEIKPHLHSTNFEEVSAVMREALGKGVECWNVDLKFTPKGVKLLGVTNTTEDLLKY